MRSGYRGTERGVEGRNSVYRCACKRINSKEEQRINVRSEGIGENFLYLLSSELSNKVIEYYS